MAQVDDILALYEGVLTEILKIISKVLAYIIGKTLHKSHSTFKMCVSVEYGYQQ